MAEELVFAYGTLLPGRRHAGVARRAGLRRHYPAAAAGLELWHLDPEGYPAAVPGSGRVRGAVLVLAAAGLCLLDELEGTAERPPHYRRVRWRTTAGEGVWLYLFARPERLALPGARRLRDGAWGPRLSER